jgi:AdoMet-dependent heme synthase
MGPLSWINSEHAESKRRHLQSLMGNNGRNNGEARRNLHTIYLFLTRKCNLSCSHCYIDGVGPHAKDKDFNLETVTRIFEKVKPAGLKKVKISGGEATLHPEFFQILDYLNTLGLEEIVLETNGMIHREHLINRLPAIRNLTVYVSLDHFVAEAHDLFRKRAGAYEKTTGFLQLLGKTNVRSVVTTTAYKNNYRHILEIIETVLSWGITRHRTLLNIHPLGNAKNNLSNILTIDELIEVMDTIVQSDYFMQKKAYLTLPPALMPIETLDEIKTCGWGNDVLGLLSTGDISMCSASYGDANMIGGNIFTDDVLDVWENGLFFEELRKIGNGDVQGVCANCLLYENCRGVCKMSSYAYYGEKDAPYPLCQEFYNKGLFPEYALKDNGVNSTYQPGVIAQTR